MKIEISKYRQLIFSLLILIFSFSILAYLIFAWTPPTQSPPQGNVPAPINVGDESQVKSGGLGAANLIIGRDSYLAIYGGNVGIGTTAPTQKLDVAGYVKGTGLCIGDDCRTSWPSGGGEIPTTIVSVQAPCDGIGTAWCPSGYKVLGGGIGYTGERTCNGGEHKIYWVASYPVVQGSNQGWACGADDYKPYCYAICGK